jgi:hypothetical protein
MVSSQQDTCATSRTDGFIEIRDELGRLWCEYHPERRVIRRYHKHNGTKILYTAEIPIDSLIAGRPVVNLTRSALPD